MLIRKHKTRNGVKVFDLGCGVLRKHPQGVPTTHAFPHKCTQTSRNTSTLGIDWSPMGSGKRFVSLTDIFPDLRFLLLNSTNVSETRLSHFFARVLPFFSRGLIIKVIGEKMYGL